MCQCCPHKETSQLIRTTNILTGFYMRAILALNVLNINLPNIFALKCNLSKASSSLTKNLSDFWKLISQEKVHKTCGRKAPHNS